MGVCAVVRLAFCRAACVGQTFLSASEGRSSRSAPDWEVGRTGRLESLRHIVWRGVAGPELWNSGLVPLL